MLHPIKYEENHFIIVNDIPNSIFYFFDFDIRSSEKNMEFEHFHSYYEIHILLSPSATHFIKGVSYHIQANDFVLLPPSLLHKSCYPKGEPSKRLVISFMYRDDGYGFKESYNELLSPFHQALPIYRFDEDTLNILTGLINQIVDLSYQSDSQELSGIHELTMHSIFTQFLYHLNQFQSNNIYKEETNDDKLSNLIYAVANYIHTHYMDVLTLDGLAKSVYMSSYYLSHQFKRITGYTITQYIQQVRIRNCQFLLINSPMKITEISSNCGFTSFSQFNRVFHKFCGESPSEYRKRKSNNGSTIQVPLFTQYGLDPKL